MKNLSFAYCILICVLFSSCTRKAVNNGITDTVEKNETISDGYTTTSKRNKTGASNSVEHENTIMGLDDHIRGLPGVNVTGAGARAVITVRGVSSFQSGSNEPLFILNGSPMSSYSSAYTAVNAVDIKRVTILTDAASTGIYGSRGANGVIVITLKNTR